MCVCMYIYILYIYIYIILSYIGINRPGAINMLKPYQTQLEIIPSLDSPIVARVGRMARMASQLTSASFPLAKSSWDVVPGPNGIDPCRTLR